eukprot:8987869-Alexandrium_andersonii.AAC.1
MRLGAPRRGRRWKALKPAQCVSSFSRAARTASACSFISSAVRVESSRSMTVRVPAVAKYTT